jgi:hypothetical protein
LTINVGSHKRAENILVHNMSQKSNKEIKRAFIFLIPAFPSIYLKDSKACIPRIHNELENL